MLYQIILLLVMNNFVKDLLMHRKEISKVCKYLVINSGKMILMIMWMKDICTRSQ
jgi:hypothetical protein